MLFIGKFCNPNVNIKMYIGTEVEKQLFTRKSKLDIVHHYFRYKTIVILRCDNCKQLFKRDKGNIDPRRLSNNFFHCCSTCDAKKFAQRKGVERRTVWDMPASSLKNISEL
jgi:hypothetical protein